MSKRLSLILRDAEERQLEPFLDEGTAERRALTQWVRERGMDAVTSEAATLRALLAAGAETLTDLSLDAGYAELAVAYGTDEADNERSEARRRYVRRTEATQ